MQSMSQTPHCLSSSTEQGIILPACLPHFRRRKFFLFMFLIRVTTRRRSTFYFCPCVWTDPRKSNLTSPSPREHSLRCCCSIELNTHTGQGILYPILEMSIFFFFFLALVFVKKKVRDTFANWKPAPCLGADQCSLFHVHLDSIRSLPKKIK